MTEDEMIEIIKENSLHWIVRCSGEGCRAGVLVSKSYTPFVNGAAGDRITRTAPEPRFCIACGVDTHIRNK
jgi:hypothetical protein